MAMGREARVDDDPKYKPKLLPATECLPVTKPRATVEPMARTTRGLRDVLFEEIDAIRNGTADTQRSLAIAKLAGQIINIARAEMDFRKLTKGDSEGEHDLLEAKAAPQLEDKSK